MRAAAVVVLMVALGCGGTGDKPAPIANGRAATTCSEQMAELKPYLLAVLDPTRPAVAVPYPTGDAARDKVIAELRARQRDQSRPVDPSKRVGALTADVQPGRLERELAPCPAALAQLSRVGEAAPGVARDAMAEIADAIRTCDCNVDVPLVRALFYLRARGPD